MSEATKVLIVTYYWPPAGGPGVQRWVKFVKYLKQFGITPVVVCPQGANYPVLDPLLQQDIPSDLEVLSLPIFEPARVLSKLAPQKSRSISKGMVNTQNPSLLERIMMTVRGHLFLPDPRKFWINPSVRRLERYLEHHPEIKLVITTGPPHSVHLIGKKLQQSRGIKWMADFRDPWTDIYYHKALNLMGWAQRRHLNLEQEVLESADRILTTSATTAASFQSRTPRAVSVITNGYDIEDFKTISVNDTGPSDKFRLTHVGTMMEPRNPLVVWKALASLIEEQDLDGFETFADDLEIELTGNVAAGVIESINNEGLGDYLVLAPNGSHKQAIEAMARGEILLLSERDEQDAHYIIPAKLFEYLALSRPILALGPAQSAIEPILKSTESGTYFVQGDYDGVTHYLSEAYRAFKFSSSRKNRVSSKVYERKNLTQQLAVLIKEITA
jgi:glycosyltransferase involved in cell wall biosynthesis